MNVFKCGQLAAWIGIGMMSLPVAPLLAQELPGVPAAADGHVGLTPRRSPSTNPEPNRLGVQPGQVVSPPAGSVNQELADTIALHLRHSQQLRHYHVDISYQDGIVELTGQVADQAQREEVLRIVHGVPGVERIRDRLVIRQGGPLTRTQGTQAVDDPPPLYGDTLQPGPLPKPVDNLPPAKEGNGSLPPEPTPIFQPAPPGTPHPVFQPPRMPPYAWPTYAPYNNLSRVAYPNLYPYYSWPFIGPFYPFPKIPPGWRSIELTWQDGSWWYGKKAKSHDWWRIRYW